MRRQVAPAPFASPVLPGPSFRFPSVTSCGVGRSASWSCPPAVPVPVVEPPVRARPPRARLPSQRRSCCVREGATPIVPVATPRIRQTPGPRRSPFSSASGTLVALLRTGLPSVSPPGPQKCSRSIHDIAGPSVSVLDRSGGGCPAVVGRRLRAVLTIFMSAPCPVAAPPAYLGASGRQCVVPFRFSPSSCLAAWASRLRVLPRPSRRLSLPRSGSSRGDSTPTVPVANSRTH